MKKKLTITIEYNTEDNPDEYQVLKEELELVLSDLSVGNDVGYHSYDNEETGEIYTITQFKIEEV